jgi:TolA-binding protein
VKKLIIISLIVILLSGCAVKRSKFKQLEGRVVTAEEKISILEEQFLLTDFTSINLTNEHIQALNSRLNILESRVYQTPDNSFTSNIDHIPGNMVDDEIHRLYNEGRRLYEIRDFSSAIRVLTSVAQQAPNHDLAANSHYWIGESYYAMGDFSAARQSFQHVQDRYPNSNKFIDAQVKIAMTWIRQNRRDLARPILLAIKRDFPNYERMSLVDQNLRLTQ